MQAGPQLVPAFGIWRSLVPKEEKKTSEIASVYELKVTLADSRPPIWRRFQVESAVTLQQLHLILQIVMGWRNCHLHGFRIPQPVLRGSGRRLLPIEEGDEESTRLADLLRRPKDRLVYDYDFGDDWEHELVLEAVVPRSSTARYPIVLGGRRACPPDDVGGIPGYYHFLEAIKDPKHPEHEGRVAWGGENFDPARFDLQAVNRALHGGWGPARSSS
jgi:hypothetical protein